jgi:hypothetical protein
MTDAEAATKTTVRPFGGVTKDPLDLRDLMYETGLHELPFSIDNRKNVPIILDQGQEGACTGFGLAAVVNYLFHNRRIDDTERRLNRKQLTDSASARMLYEMAKRYDEWEGENYDGSSIRGAMKGWLRHGVCRWEDWPYVEADPGDLTPSRQLNALDAPLGAYLRVRHSHLNQMHGALSETGILYASAQVHTGWYEINPETGKIPYRSEKAGGHAFSIVGYDRDGFWIQNSWGPDWGKNGFCHIGYDDWLENSFDCWAARLGVPTLSLALTGETDRGRVSTFDHVPHEPELLSQIKPHFINLGNDGALSQSGRYSTTVNDIKNTVIDTFEATSTDWPGPARLLFYAHGGLNNEKASASRIATMRPHFLANGIYPVHFMWESGLFDSIQGILQDALRRGRFQGWGEALKGKFFDLVDEGIELGGRYLGRPVWAEMKENARLASDNPAGGAYVAVQLFKTLFEESQPELHLVGHSAGSIFFAHLLPLLAEADIPVKSLTLMAPACTIGLFNSNYVPHLGMVEQMNVFTLTDAAERGDTVTSAYHKSLLYLVSESFETKRRSPLLGMEKFLSQDQPLKNTLGTRVELGETVISYTRNGTGNIDLASESQTHGGFDNDEDTMNSILRIITDKTQPAMPFKGK